MGPPLESYSGLRVWLRLGEGMRGGPIWLDRLAAKLSYSLVPITPPV